MASNTKTLEDEDGESSDWVELLNVSSTNVNLNGWALTDDPANPRKWRFPPTTLAPGEHLLVFASDKDRRIPGNELHTSFKLGADGDFLGLTDAAGTIVHSFGDRYPQQLPDVSFGVVAEQQELSLISTNSPVRYFVPSDDSLAAIWNLTEFDDGPWHPASNGLGFDSPAGPLANAIATDISPVAESAAGVYLRYAFESPNGDLAPLLLRARYDDGFIAYLNGLPVADANAPLEPAWNSTATAGRDGADPLTLEEFDLSIHSGLLHEGTNILAIQLLNVAPGDADLLMNAELVGYTRSINTNAWRYFVQSTPREINGAGETNLGPLILHAAHAPAVPAENESITVTARLQATFNPPADLQLTYRVMYGAETTIPMLDNGQNNDGAANDGLYGAIIPANAADPGQMVRWFMRATDTKGLETRWPPYRDIRNSPQYLGTIIDDSRLSNPLPVLHWFIQVPSRADSTTGTRASLFWNGVFYDNIFMNLHGQSSQGFPKKSYNLDFNPAFHFQWAGGEIPVEDVNLLTTYPDKAHVRNILAYETYRDSGHAYHFTVPVRVQRNGEFFSDAHMVEDGDADFLERVGLNRSGALYKMYNTFNSSVSGVEKKTRKFENNADLQALLRGIQSASRTRFIYDNVNIPAMINYLAAMIITGNVDCCHKNYYIYRDTGVTDEWQFLPWDLDLSFGRNWTGSLHYFDDTMYYQNGLFIGGNNTLISAIYSNQTFRNMYLRRVRTLMDELLQPPSTPAAELKYEKRIRELYAEIGPDAQLDFAKWPTWGSRQTMPRALGILTNEYFPKRRNYLYNLRTIPGPVASQAEMGFGPLEFNPASGTQTEEYFTVTNGTSGYLDVSGWTIEGAVDHTFAPGTVLPPNGTIHLSPNVAAFRGRTTSPRGGQSLFVQGNYSGQLSARGELLTLRNRNGQAVASHVYPGEPTAAQQSLRIVEIMFAPPATVLPGLLQEDLEYLVLQNIGNAPLDLHGARFSNGITFTFEGSTPLAPRERIYLAKNPEAFALFYGTNYTVAGPYIGQLANGGEELQVHDAAGENVLEFAYERSWHAPTAAGSSLQLIDPLTSVGNFGASAAWAPSAFAGGSAGMNQAWASWRKSQFTPEQLASAEISGANADPDADNASNHAEFIAGTSPTEPASNLHVQIVAGSSSALRFEAAAGRQYYIDAATDADGPWVTVTVLPRTSQSGAVQIPVEPTEPTRTRYFRLRVEL